MEEYTFDIYGIEVSIELDENEEDYAASRKNDIAAWIEKNSKSFIDDAASILCSYLDDLGADYDSECDFSEYISIMSISIWSDNSANITLNCDSEILGGHFLDITINELFDNYRIDSFALNG